MEHQTKRLTKHNILALALITALATFFFVGTIATRQTAYAANHKVPISPINRTVIVRGPSMVIERPQTIVEGQTATIRAVFTATGQYERIMWTFKVCGQQYKFDGNKRVSKAFKFSKPGKCEIFVEAQGLVQDYIIVGFVNDNVTVIKRAQDIRPPIKPVVQTQRRSK